MEAGRGEGILEGVRAVFSESLSGKCDGVGCV